ncbi:obscurin-like_isoform X2 [Hexamita inflata]|uniref:Obscurin-like isoform X2 n=1 Tax=Hexamita inflata TaxID=28002 RepID=A0AA86UCH0_9EUKA|nr:obscurin-like isoform X2 [Hexamita inflata]
MQSIIRINSSDGINPDTNSEADKYNVETAFIRLPLGSEYYQYKLSVRLGHSKLTKHFFVDCNLCNGFDEYDKSYSKVQTVIMLNCKFNKHNKSIFNSDTLYSDHEPVNYNNVNPQIYIEILDDSCLDFINAEKSAGHSVSELTIKNLCDQLKLICISDDEKIELISGFALRKRISNEEVLSALRSSGFDYLDYVLKNKIDINQIIYSRQNSDQQQEEIFMQNNDFPLFLQSNYTSNSQVTSKSILSLKEKLQIMSVFTDNKKNHNKINEELIKHELDLVYDRIIQFVNNNQNQILAELTFKEDTLQHEKEGRYEIQQYIKELKAKIQELQRVNDEQKIIYEQKMLQSQQQYDKQLILCKTEIETIRKEYFQDLQTEYQKYKSEIEQLKQSNESEKLTTSKHIERQQQQQHIQQEINSNDSITIQMQIEYQLLRQQLIDEKQDHDDQYNLIQQQLKLKNQRNTELQKQLTEEKNQRIIFFQQLQYKQSEITKQLESNVLQQAARIVHLENDNQSLLNTLSALKDQIERLNIQELQQSINDLEIQLSDKDKYITKLLEQIQSININNLQDKQIEKVITLLKKIEITE